MKQLIYKKIRQELDSDGLGPFEAGIRLFCANVR